MLVFDDEYLAVHPKVKLWRFLVKNCKKSGVKHSIENPILLNFLICLQPFVQDCRYPDFGREMNKNYIFSLQSAGDNYIIIWMRFCKTIQTSG